MKLSQPYRLAYILALLTMLGVMACHKDVAPERPNDRGDKILDVDLPSNFARLLNWSPDGRELFYLAQPPGAVYQIQALNVQTKITRLVAQDSRWQYMDIDNAAVAADGQYAYLIARKYIQASSPHYLYRISLQQGGQVTLLDSSTYDRLAYSSGLSAAPTGNRVGFRVAYDSIHVHTLATRPITRLQATGSLLLFSPDSNQLLYSATGFGNTYQVWSFAAQSSTDITLQAPVVSSEFKTRRGTIVWKDNGIQYIYPDRINSDYTTNIWNVTQQKATLAYMDAKDDYPILEDEVDWSPDGRRIIFTTSNLNQSATSASVIIYSTDLNSLKTTKVATVSRASDEHSLYAHSYIISPDNSRFAYVINGSVYVAPIQP